MGRMLAESTPNTLALRIPTGRIVLDRSEIGAVDESLDSMMPEGGAECVWIKAGDRSFFVPDVRGRALKGY